MTDTTHLQCIDLPALLETVQELPIEERAKAMMLATGCELWPQHSRIVRGPSARLAMVGGLSVASLVQAGLAPTRIAQMARRSAGAAASMAYLAVAGGSTDSAYNKVVLGLGHGSCLHAVQVSVVLAGISTAAENELNGQRDLVHLARLTESRTRAQSCPVLVCMDEGMVAGAQRMLDAFDEVRHEALSQSVLDPKDALETANNLAPAMRAGIVLVSGSLRNVQKLFEAIEDSGKEMEYRQALREVRAQLAQLWPELFTKNPWSQHFAKPKVFEGWMQTLNLQGLDAVEVGAGHGALTRALLGAGVNSVEAWEIDQAIAPVDDPKVQWHLNDFTLDLESVAVEGKLLAAFPPYGLLPELLALSRRARATLLMVPGRALVELSAQGFHVLACLAGDAFEPVSKGSHFIVAKGISFKK